MPNTPPWERRCFYSWSVIIEDKSFQRDGKQVIGLKLDAATQSSFAIKHFSQ